MKYIYHTNSIRKERLEYIFTKNLSQVKGKHIKREMSIIKGSHYNYSYYLNDKKEIPKNDFDHYFVDSNNSNMKKVSNRELYMNKESVNQNKIYNKYTSQKTMRIEKLEKRKNKTLLFRNISILYIDIEVYLKNTSVNMLEKGVHPFESFINPINSVSLVKQDNNTGELTYDIFIYDMNDTGRPNFSKIKERLIEKYSEIDTDESKTFLDLINNIPNYDIHYFDNEKELLEALAHYFVENNFDIYTGWNIYFDLNYIYTRFYKKLGKKYANAISPFFKLFLEKRNLGLNIDEIKLAEIVEETENVVQNGYVIGQEIIYKVKIAGVNIIDYLSEAKRQDAIKSQNKSSYTLENYAYEELGETKVDYQALGFGNLNELFDKGFEEFVMYSCDDTVLPWKFEQKLGYIKQLVIINQICQIQNIERSLSSNSLWEDTISMYANIVKNKREIFIDKKNRDEIKTSFPAALDMDVHELKQKPQSAILTYDWASLYPTTMIGNNISPETQKNITKGYHKDIHDLIYFMYDYNVKLNDMLNLEALAKSVEDEINRIQKDVSEGKYRKDNPEKDLQFLSDKLRAINSKSIRNIDMDTIKKFNEYNNENEEHMKGMDELDKVLSNTSGFIEGYSYAITSFFKNDNVGLVPYILKENFFLRIGYKKMKIFMNLLLNEEIDLKEYKKNVEKYNAQNTEENIEFLEMYEKGDLSRCKDIMHFVDDLQNGLKIFLNSGFGVFGNKYFKWYNKDLATAITLSARRILVELILWVSRLLNEKFNDHNRRIVYGATDSIFVRFDNLFTSEELDIISNEEMIKRIFNFLEEIKMKEYINKFIKYMETEIFNSKDNLWALDMEKLAREGLFLHQKNYILKIIWKEANTWKTEYDLLMKGIQLKKVNTTDFLKSEHMQKAIIDLMFKSRKIDPEFLNIESYVEKWFDDFVKSAKENLHIIGGSLNIKPEKLGDGLDQTYTKVIKPRVNYAYTGIAIWNNFIKRLSKNDKNYEKYLYYPQGFSEKATPLYMVYDDDYIKEYIEYPRKTEPVRKIVSMMIPKRYYLTPEIKDEIYNRINFQEQFEKKVLSQIENYIKIPEGVNLSKHLRQRNLLKYDYEYLKKKPRVKKAPVKKVESKKPIERKKTTRKTL